MRLGWVIIRIVESDFYLTRRNRSNVSSTALKDLVFVPVTTRQSVRMLR